MLPSPERNGCKFAEVNMTSTSVVKADENLQSRRWGIVSLAGMVVAAYIYFNFIDRSPTDDSQGRSGSPSGEVVHPFAAIEGSEDQLPTRKAGLMPGS
ncbi:MAG: hypothetical protein RI963_3004 [Planctomycetota bacterium]